MHQNKGKYKTVRERNVAEKKKKLSELPCSHVCVKSVIEEKQRQKRYEDLLNTNTIKISESSRPWQNEEACCHAVTTHKMFLPWSRNVFLLPGYKKLMPKKKMLPVWQNWQTLENQMRIGLFHLPEFVLNAWN